MISLRAKHRKRRSLTWDISVEDVMELKIEQAENRGEARGAERLAELLKAGMTIEDALKQIKESTEIRSVSH